MSYISVDTTPEPELPEEEPEEEPEKGPWPLGGHKQGGGAPRPGEIWGW